MTRNNVRIAIRDSTDSHNVAFFDNKAGIKYKSANLQRFLAGSASILTLKYNSKDIDSIRSGCKLAFRYKNRDYWLNVMSFEKKGFEVELTAYSLGLELNNETRGEHKPANAMSIAEYVAYYDPEHALTIGVNEVSDKRIKLEWTGTDTILARLFSVANSFDAELDFNVELNDDYSLKRQVLNIYRKGNLGTNKLSQPVRVGKELKVINYSDNIKELRTAVRATGKDGLTIDGLNKKIYDDNKELLYYSSGMTVYAPQSRDRFPSVGKGSNDNWIVEDLGETQYETKEALWGYLYSEIQKKSLPEITYEVEGAIDAGIGDTQTLIDDKHFEPALYVQARVSELEDDILTGKVTKSTFINFERKYSQIADELQKRVNELVEASIPYTIKVSSDNGTVFKNSTGTSTFKARVFKGEKEITSDVTWRWALDGNVTVGMQYLAKASAIKDTAVLTVSAYVGNNEVATTEITLTNVNDGADGKNGNDGLPGKDGVGLQSTVVTYGLSTSETTQPTSWTAQVPALVKGQYFWTKTVWIYTDNTGETGYQKTYIPKNGNDGNDGIAGKDGVGIKSTAITYASSTSGTTKPSSGWSATIPSVSAGNFLWTKTIWTYTDNTSETGYSVAKMGETGATGNGIANTVITYGLSASETTEPATWASNMPVLVKGMYLWTRTVQIYTNGKSTTSYQKGYIAKDGAQGRNLLRRTNQGKTNWNWIMQAGDKTIESVSSEGINAVKLTKGTATPQSGFSVIYCSGVLSKLIESDTQYVLSFDVYPSVNVTFNATLMDSDSSDRLTTVATMNAAAANKWTKVSCILTRLQNLPANIGEQVVYLTGMSSANGVSYIIKNIKLEKGNVLTDWTPAPEDTQEQIDSKADSTLTQEQLNALAEQDNLIKAEMEAKASIDTVDKWITAYENYVKANDADKAKSEQALKEASERIVQMKYEVNNLKLVWEAIDRFMSFQNEGLVIGKKDGSAYAKFSDDRISLFSGSSEVMYISQGTLNIANGIFTKTIQIGRFRFETHPADADMLVLRYLGG